MPDKRLSPLSYITLPPNFRRSPAIRHDKPANRTTSSDTTPKTC
ncbi:hypothetical protein [Bacteroides caccae]|nr:hypothetical protein [Bacteroides caccae]MCS3356506.1 hypothetical protein [Bacteroides thetaiotaomicron]